MTQRLKKKGGEMKPTSYILGQRHKGKVKLQFRPHSVPQQYIICSLNAGNPL